MGIENEIERERKKKWKGEVQKTNEKGQRKRDLQFANNRIGMHKKN